MKKIEESSSSELSSNSSPLLALHNSSPVRLRQRPSPTTPTTRASKRLKTGRPSPTSTPAPESSASPLSSSSLPTASSDAPSVPRFPGLGGVARHAPQARVPSWLVPKTPQGDSLTLRITGAHGPDQFLQLATSPDWSTEYLPRIRTLHLELNEEWQTDYVDDILAVALRSLCQHSGSREGSEHGTQEDGMQEKVGRKKKSNGLQGNGNHKKNDSGGLRFVDDDDDDELELGPSNSSSDNESSEAGKPHRTGPLREIHLQARGNFLFTHNSYSLRNPAAATSWVGSDCDRRAERLYPNLDRIAHGRQTVADREDIDIRVSEWPKAVVKALLELRVDKVVIDGPMDGSLKNELIETMTRIESENNEDDDGEDGVLKPGEVWEMERIERKVASRRPGVGSGKGRGRARASALNERSVEQVGLDFMFPTKEEHRVILGWRVE